MLNPEIVKKWEMPLFEQWSGVRESVPTDSLNYSSGGALGFIHLRGLAHDEAFSRAVTEVLGQNVPTQPKQTVYTRRAAMLWLSPDEWLLVCAYAEKAELLQNLQTALSGVYAQVVDNSCGFMLMRIHGQNAETVLRHISPYDVESMQAGQCVQTVTKKATSTIVKVAENDYALIFRRSFADYLWRVLQKTAKPYGYALQKSWQFDQPDWQRYTVQAA